MNTAILNIKTDPETKERLKEFASQVGLPVSALMNAQIKQMLRDRKVAFDITLKPTPALENAMRKAEADLAAGDVDTFESKQDALEHLRSL